VKKPKYLAASMNTDCEHSIRYFNRYTNQLETESVYGQGFLKWAYESVLGRMTTELIVKRALFSKWYGWRMDREASRTKILPFIQQFELQPNEFLESPETFKTFNEFFFRKLKPEARPIQQDPGLVVFPADGRHLGFADLSTVQSVFVKGQRFDLQGLLQQASLARRFERGTLVLSRLCPVDYHRFHFPVAGRNGGEKNGPRLINGSLYSVNPIALRRNLSIFWQNKRYLTEIETEDMGTVLFLEIGATCVGSVVHTHEAGKQAAKGDEKGYFRFGGSSVITLFEPGSVRLADDLLAQSEQGVELYAKMGDEMGRKEG